MSTPEDATPKGMEANPEAKLDRATLVKRVCAWVEVRLQEAALRDLAREIGVSKSTIDKLARGATMPDKTWPKLRYWYLRDRLARRASLHDPESIRTTLENIPERRRAWAIRSTVDHLRALHRETNAPEPEWLDMLLGWAEDGASIPKRPAPPEPSKRRGGRQRHAI